MRTELGVLLGNLWLGSVGSWIARLALVWLARKWRKRKWNNFFNDYFFCLWRMRKTRIMSRLVLVYSVIGDFFLYWSLNYLLLWILVFFLFFSFFLHCLIIQTVSYGKMVWMISSSLEVLSLIQGLVVGVKVVDFRGPAI